MNINKICIFKQNNKFSNSIINGQSMTNKKTLSNSTPMSDISSDTIKANFLPSFGKYVKVKNVTLIDRQTGKETQADLKKEKIGDFISYKIFKDKKESGYIDIDIAADFPKEKTEYYLTNYDNKIPQILHIRTIEGDKYANIGTTLVNAAVDESIKAGKDGNLWTISENDYAYALSNYNSKTNPIPFYYKLGFKSISTQEDEKIKNCLNSLNYEELPDRTLLLLTPDSIQKNKKYFADK